jgi:tetratricopeptide (TPR) repeat protein
MTQPVRAWEQTVVIPTYPTPPADKNPMFLEKRVYQGSSGKVYPCPFTDRVSDEKVDRPYGAVFLENEYIRLMLLPEIGGRIHMGLDKTNGYDFFYRQNVIKPALVGLLGPWISGGVEFNWPQHHRPTTFMPVEHSIEEHADGSRTVWLSEHEPMNRMKGMVGICLYPGKSFVEAKVRLYNRTPFVQTFLWWANAGVHVHDEYQAFFPPDVTFVADHAKRAVIDFPIAHGPYYGVDYTRGVDLRWYKNIPVPTSYMVMASKYDFFGGYDHRRKAGLVHFADHHIAPGKKMWTWGNHEFGYAWDRELTDSDGPYIELMAGVYTDNQPDFSWLQPYETRTFRQYWYPIQQIGTVKNANRAVAVNLEVDDGGATQIGVYATERFDGATILLVSGGRLVFQTRADLKPGVPFLATVPDVEPGCALRVVASSGDELIRYAQQPPVAADPVAATEPPAPRDTASIESLYLTGVHLEQYRHATRDPEAYWNEALAREPGNVRANHALGVSKLRRGLFAESERHFRAAIGTLARWNPNPFDGEPHYYLGLALQYQGRLEEAHAAFAKAAWNYGCRSAASYSLAQIASLRGEFEAALERLDESLASNVRHNGARNLKAALLMRLGHEDAAREIARETLAMDPLDAWAQWMEAGHTGGKTAGVTGTQLDVAFDYAAAGLWAEAAEVVAVADSPALLYPLAWFLEQTGDGEAAAEVRAKAAQARPDYYFPSRLEELQILERAGDARAAYYLGNLLYDKRRYEEAVACWRRSIKADVDFATAWRNLGIASYNVLRQPDEALRCYACAFTADRTDARVLYEYDQLRKRTGAAPSERLELLEQFPDLVRQRDDLTIELVALYNLTGQARRALEILMARRFHPWEGGEGKASGQYVASHLILGREDLGAQRFADALAHFDAAMVYPANLGEGKHLLTEDNHIHYFRGVALARLGREGAARAAFEAATAGLAEAPAMAYYQALALRELGSARATRSPVPPEARIDYFATSLPNFLIFEDDLEKRSRVEREYLSGLSLAYEGRCEEAVEHFRAALDLDPSHLDAAMELALLRKEQRVARL